MKPTNRSSRQRGSELVEFALMVPALAALIGLIGLGSSMVSTEQIMDNAAREGARVSVAPGSLGDTTDIQNSVIAYAAANGVTLAAGDIAINQDVIVNPGTGACGAGNSCITASQVTVSYPYSLSKYLGTLCTLSSTVEMRNLY